MRIRPCVGRPPTFKLTVEEYNEIKKGGAIGDSDLSNIFENVVADLINRDQIVEPAWRGCLLQWLQVCIPAFLELRLLRTLTTKQAQALMRQIKQDGEHLIERLTTLYAKDLIPSKWASSDRGICQERDIQLLKRILARAEQYQPRQKRNGTNAANPALRNLSYDICAFWAGQIGQNAWSDRPLIERNSPFYEFAKYIFAFVGQPCDGRMIAERLRKPLFRILDAVVFSAGPRGFTSNVKYYKQKPSSEDLSDWAESWLKSFPGSSIYWLPVVAPIKGRRKSVAPLLEKFRQHMTKP